MIALIDYDILCYRIGFACQKSTYEVYSSQDPFGDGVPVAVFNTTKEAKAWINGEEEYNIVTVTEAEPVTHCYYLLDKAIEAVLTALKTREFVGFLSGSRNFRFAIAKTRPYKGNRDANKKPIHYSAIREYLIKYWNGKIVDNIEADDAIGIAHTVGKTIIVTIDKDLNQLPGDHYNFVKQELYTVSKEQAIKNFWLQMLTGDRVDNIQGIPGIGEVKAAKILDTAANKYETCVYKEYEKYYKDTAKDVFEEHKQLLKILDKVA